MPLLMHIQLRAHMRVCSPILQNMEYKFIELMSLQFSRSPDTAVQHHITYRYNAMKVSTTDYAQHATATL
jgi:hypothetical protein